MTRTPTLPPDDPKMWRRLLSRTHPDCGGDHELFIWTGAVRQIICDGEIRANPPGPGRAPRQPENQRDEVARVPFDPAVDFSELTQRAVKLAESISGVHGTLLKLLHDCEPPPLQTGAWTQRGASYRRLAAIGHAWGMSKTERGKWYRLAEDVPLSDRHAGHILSRTKGRAA